MDEDFKIKKYNDPEALALAWFSNEEEPITIEELRESTVGGFDFVNNASECTFNEFIDGLKTQGYWGWIDDNKTIHLWVGKQMTMEELIHFFAHEIAHMTPEEQIPYGPTDDMVDFIEEMRVEGYGRVAVMAYNFAKEINSKSYE